MKIAVIGTGYVGLVAGVCFADTGHHVICVDRDETKINSLKAGKVPIYEPGLEDILELAVKSKHIQFTTDLATSVASSEVIFIAVGTPEKEDGSADLAPTFAVVDAVAKAANSTKYIVLKSTVPVGTAEQVRGRLKDQTTHKISVISNPEFLKEGAAVEDFLKPDRIVIGCDSDDSKKIMEQIYAPFVKNGHPIYFMDNASAELTKYAANAFLSIKISFINELARLADAVGADIAAVKRGFTTDRRINPAFFHPGVGYGGSCFPKDTQALAHTGRKHRVTMRLTEAAELINDEQKMYLFEMVKKHFKSLSGRQFAIWGLSFKPRTDDVREAPSLKIIEALVQAGATVKAYDPIANENAKAMCPVAFETTPSADEALIGSDALLVITEWNEFRSPDFTTIKQKLKTPVIFDGRNVYDPIQMNEMGFNYYCIGRQAVFNKRGAHT